MIINVDSFSDIFPFLPLPNNYWQTSSYIGTPYSASTTKSVFQDSLDPLSKKTRHLAKHGPGVDDLGFLQERGGVGTPVHCSFAFPEGRFRLPSSPLFVFSLIFVSSPLFENSPIRVSFGWQSQHSSVFTTPPRQDRWGFAHWILDYYFIVLGNWCWWIMEIYPSPGLHSHELWLGLVMLNGFFFFLPASSSI